MSTGVSYTQLKRLQSMTDEEFADLILLGASILLPASRAVNLVGGRIIKKQILKLLAFLMTKARANKIKLALWVFAILKSAIDNAGEIQNAVLKWLNDLLGTDISEISNKAIKDALGKAAAERLKAEILRRYHLEFPIDNLLSPTLMDELGAWFATMINDKASARLGRDVFIVSTVFPPDNLLTEIDVFLTDEINLKLGTDITGFMYNQNLVEELKEQFIDRLQRELVNQFAQTKGQIINQYALEGGADSGLKMQIAAQVMTDALEIFSSFQIDGIGNNAASYYSNNKKRIHAKMRQRAYRLNHVENRVWVHR
jgi:DNA-binding ferritin-like protein (Dps family)